MSNTPLGCDLPEMSKIVEKHRTYGSAPYALAVVHGGPGAAGEMAPVARELAGDHGILEPLQTATSLEGQVDELRMTLESYAAPPAMLIGFSWGAWLSYFVAAGYPTLVRKLLMVAGGPFDEGYVAQLQETRLQRLNEQEQAEWQAIGKALSDPAAEDKDAPLARLGVLAAKTDAYDPIVGVTEATDTIITQGNVFQGVWAAAAEWRRNGGLLQLGRQIQCPVVAIHGDHDPHPAEGVQEPLSALLKDFRFVLLKNCGHTPWLADIAAEDSELRGPILERLKRLTRTGSPAMKSRGRKLIARLNRIIKFPMMTLRSRSGRSELHAYIFISDYGAHPLIVPGD